MADSDFLRRRSIIQALGAGVMLTTVGCAPATRALKSDYPRAYSRKPWAAPHISMDAVIRVVVGHRPYRPTDFRVERQQTGDKTLIHNYGHGGGGLSLGRGSSLPASGGRTPHTTTAG